MTAKQMLVAHRARQAVIHQLATAYENWCEERQLAVATGDLVRAKEAFANTRYLLRALWIEEHDTPPKGLG